MEYVGRSRELGSLRAALDSSSSSVIRVSGLPGVGKSELVRRAVADYRGFTFRCPPLPDEAQRRAFGQAWLSRPDEFNEGFMVPDVGPWSDCLAEVAEEAATPGRPWVLVLDDADRLLSSRARIAEPLAKLIEQTVSIGSTVHVVLIARDAEALSFKGLERSNSVHLRVPPLTLQAVAPWLPGKRPEDRIRAYGVFGGTPRVIRSLDRAVTVGSNVRRLLLDDSGGLAEGPLAWLERVVQTPARYVGVLEALAGGEQDWAKIHAALPDLARSGQVAPYLTRLESLGFIERRRSLDAAPRSRATRYRIVDPLIAFWFRFVLPWRLSQQSATVSAHYADRIRPDLHHHMEGILPALARQHMAHDSLGTLGTSARESGSLWSVDTDISLAGTLASGAAFYGITAWKPPSLVDSPLERLDNQVRVTRYGFGREGRLRIVFTGRPTPAWLRREVVRRHDAYLIDAEMLLGEKERATGVHDPL
jgi:AAA+ ATPase superfamily predicted ATPase